LSPSPARPNEFERNVQGAVQGFASSTGAVASIAGLLLGGVLYDSLGNRVFLVPAILVVLTCSLAFFLPAKSKTSG
jgi:DHA1 family tetracycline resistance protein-like MFS transporter